MKPHLPVHLFRAVIAVMTAIPVLAYSVSSSAYADLTDVKDAQTITTRQSGSVEYSYYEGISFKVISYSSTESAYGGAIYASGAITLNNNGSVEFSGTTTSSDSEVHGGAIYLKSSLMTTMNSNGSVVFESNVASAKSSTAGGGAICGYSSTIILENNGNVLFRNNSVAAEDGAYSGALAGVKITLNNNGGVEFSGNTATSSSHVAYGGAIGVSSNGSLMLNNNDRVAFINNKSNASGWSSRGGAIYGYDHSTITLNNNGSVEFSYNTTSSDSEVRGGAISGEGYSTITLSGNGNVEFNANTAIVERDETENLSLFADGGAILVYNMSMNLSSNVKFIGNKLHAGASSVSGYTNATSRGGALYVSNSLLFHDVGNLEFSGNESDSKAVNSVIDIPNEATVYADANSAGGAIYIPGGDTMLTFSNNDEISFNGNMASTTALTSVGEVFAYSFARGGAISAGHTSFISVCSNTKVEIFGNIAKSSISSISYSNPQCWSKALGGAIFTYGSLHICNNDSVDFFRNVEIADTTYRLRSLYVDECSGDVINISAAKGKTVTFYDSIYVGSGAMVNLNADYELAAGDFIEQKGDIIFSGVTTVDDLYEVKGNVSGTEEEIRLSRTTEVNAMTNLYGGRLRVEDGAIYKGNGITAHKDSAATVLVKNGTLAHAGYDLKFNADTTLELSGANTISGNIVMESDSVLTFNLSSGNADSALLALEENEGNSFTQQGSLRLTLKGDSSLIKGEKYKLMTGVTQSENWTTENISVDSGSIGWDVDFNDLIWDDNVLWVYYDGLITDNPLPEPEFSPNLNRNQQVVYDTIKDIMRGGNPGGLLGELGKEVAESRDENELKSLLDAMGGAEYTTMMSSQIEGNLGHIRRLRAAAGTGQTQVPQYGLGFYINAFNSDTDVDSDAAGPGYTRTEWGAHFGVEGRPAEHLTVGLGLEKSRARVVPSNAARYHEDAVRVDAYAAYEEDGWRVLGAVGMGSHEYDLKRTLPNGSVAEAEDLSGSAVNLMAEVSYTMQLAEAHVLQPYFVAESSINKIDGFSETGAGNASLQGESRDAWATELTLGLRYLYSFAAVSGAPAATLSLHSGVVADIGDTTDDLTLRFAGSERSFTQRGADRNRWGYSAGVGVTVPVDNKVSVYGQAESILRGDTAQVDAQVGVRVVF